MSLSLRSYIALDQLMTFAFTLTGGIIIFIVSQAVLKLVIEPVQQLKSAIGQTANTLLRHQPKITMATPDGEISAALRGHAADLMSKAAVISLYQRAAWVFGLPSEDAIKEATGALHRIAHEMRSEEDKQRDLKDGRLILVEPLTSPTDLLLQIEKCLRVRTTWL